MRKRWSSTAALSACLAVLVALVGALQWRWLDEIEGHEHYRLDRRVGLTTWLFKRIVEREISGLAHAMAAPAGSRSVTGSELAERLGRWRGSTRWPDLVAEVYAVEPGAGAEELALSRLDPRATRLEPVAWPPALQPLAATLGESVARWPLAAPADVHVVPSLPGIIVPPAGADAPSALLVVLDRSFLVHRMFPEIVRMVFPSLTFDYIEVAVAEAETGNVLYSTLDIDHASEFGRADTVYGLVPEGAAPGELPAPLAAAPVIPSDEWQPTAADEEWFRDLWSALSYTGHWRIMVRRGDLPIAEEVAAARWRKVAAAFGVLALLSTSIALLAVVTRRTQRAAREQLEQLARVSHELRTPLSVLGSAGGNLADGVVGGNERIRQYGRLIRKETRRLQDLVENVLHLARRRAAAPRMEPQRVDVVELLEESLGVAEPSLREAGFTVERALPAHPVEILGEPRALRSAVLNLISNAVKYGRPARWLRLAVEQDDGSEVRIVVEDRGPGIAGREVPALFEPYARGPRAMADQTEGSGLGLAVVRDVVEAHSGRISVASPPGGGTAFTLHLPLPDAG